MNGFLVVGRGRADDVPLRLCATREEAEAVAATVEPVDVIAEAETVFGVGVSEITCVNVVEFRDGFPVKSWEARRADGSPWPSMPEPPAGKGE